MLKLPAGKYYIGDPCYVFADATWDRLLIEHEDDLNTGEIVTFENHQLWAHRTAHGDGTYKDQNENEFGVDGGQLGAVPIELIDDPSGEEYGTIIDAPHGLQVEFSNGTFWIGPIVIITDDATEDFDDDNIDGGYGGDLDLDRL